MQTETNATTSIDTLNAAISAWESRFTVRTKDGLCVDWVAGSKHSHEEFCSYLRMRQWLRSFRTNKPTETTT